MIPFVYKNILENMMLPYAEEEMPLWQFQQDNDPFFAASEKWLLAQCVAMTISISTPIENLRKHFK